MSSSELAAIEETMTEIRRNWNVMLQDQFNPIMVAMEMLQRSNPSHDFDTFMRLHSQLDEAMAVIVEKYYTGFNDAVSIFGGIVDNTNLSRDIVKGVIEGVDEFQKQIQFPRIEIPELWSKVQQYKGTFAVTDKLKQVQEQQIKAVGLSERRFFIPAARLLMGAMYDARYLTSGMLSEAADICKILETSRDAIFDLIIDEIHRLLYLKNENSFKQLFAHLVAQLPETKNLQLTLSTGKIDDFNVEGSIDDAADQESDLVLAPSEFDFDPSQRTIAYLASMVRASAILECLPTMLTVIMQRIVSELYLMGEKCIANATKEFRRGFSQSASGDDSRFVPVLLCGTMDRIQSREFDMFVPVLRRLTDNILGRLLIVASAIHKLSVTIDGIAREAGIPLDLFAFQRNCLAAIHGEIKNLLTCVLQGGKTGTSTTGSLSHLHVNSTVAIIDALRAAAAGGEDKKSKKKKKLIPLYHHLLSPEDRSMLEELPDNEGLLCKKDESAAHKLAQLLAVDPYSTLQQQAGHRLPVTPSLRYLPVIYCSVAQAERWLSLLFGSELADTRYVDATYLENLLGEQFIPALETYSTQDLTRAFTSSDSILSQPLLPVDQAIAIGRNSVHMLNCVSNAATLFLQLACALHQVPGCQAECEQLLSSLLSQFLERCDGKFRELVTSRASPTSSNCEDPAVAFMAISAQFASNEAIVQLLGQHSMLAGAEEEAFDCMVAEKELVLLERLKSDRSLHRNEVIFDHRILRSLVLLQRSLEMLPNVLTMADYGTLPGFSHCRPEFKKIEGGGLECHFFDGVYRGVCRMSANFEEQWNNFMGAVQRLAEACLFLLRVELRVHCFYYLDLAYREGRYDFDESSDEPDPYVVSLANDLFRFESLMSEWLPYSRYHFVMDELNISLSGMLISAFRYIRAISPVAGCHKLFSNVAALEQLLSLINTDTMDIALHSARQFYRLVEAGPEKFIELAFNLPYRFTLPQYQSIFDVYYRDQAGEGSLRKTYANQLVRLKYLLEKDPKSPLMLANNDEPP